ncbi:E3 ubiquitin-protein ligase UPL4-like [Phoenix dactylifera]|uniref:HECT-type E3 ubiquitin transferase n=1 Tax=Phoenix dactylifera TaxID=42345 RepID=A0A8B7BR63_PHODC|nr:E3 ubiquitin-protein ligase UPL4-like [Phoenix dactylifera]XP_008783679.1 E3 ubiquitin-protein ligase UPL4-like [Phoenix dactylifera]XP_008783680.1 E3 ubiquitin-protein ligase UPL4-like [Phoenix dactylifera]
MDRGRKRAEAGEQMPADKRACSSAEYRPGSSSLASAPPSAAGAAAVASSSEPAECDMESSSSGRSDRAGDSAYGSCDSDDEPDHGRGGFDGPSRCGASKAKFQRIFASLEDDAGPGAQLAALTELCEVLSFCMEDSIGYFPMETSIPVLVRLAGHETSPDVMLLAIRALTYLCDVMPRSADALVRHGALPVLCGKLLAFDYLDVAEQCLQALEKISRKQPVPCLQAGTIMAVLSYIDFFSTSIQRVALSTVANICKKLPLDCSSLVMESVPTLCNLLQYEDRKLVETVATCLIRIADSFSHSPGLLDELCKHGVIHKSVRLIAIDGRMSLSQSTYTGLISLLTKLASSSLVAVRTLFELNISSTLRSILMASDLSHGTPYSPFEDVQSNQVHEVLKLLNQLIPPVARDVGDIQVVLAKEKILVDQPSFLHQFSMDILPVSIQVVNSGANLYISYVCISIINNIVYFSTPEMLMDLLKVTNISSFLAGLLARKDHHVLISTLKTVEILMQKLPGVFLSSFVKEGVIYAIDSLLIKENCLQSAQQSSHMQHSDNQVAARDISRCLCYAFDSSRALSSEMKACRLGKDTVLILARHIKTTYFPSEAVNSEMGLTEILQKLKTFCAVLNDNVDRSATNDGCAQNEEYLSHILDQVMRELYGGETMSTFEFIESGIVRSLAHYLSNGKYLQGTLCDGDLSNHFLAVLRRFQTFACISLSKMNQGWENMLLTLLVRKLQNALSSFDSFPVISSHVSKPRNIYVDIPFRRPTMHPCLKIHFVREEGETTLHDYDNVLNVEPSSSLDAIEGYIWPKVSAKSNEHQMESAGKDIVRTGDIASGSTHAEGRNPEEIVAKTLQEPSFSSLSEGVACQEGQSLSADLSPRQRDLVAVTTSNLSSLGERRAEVRTGSASPSNVCAEQKLSFCFEGKQLDRSVTLYQAILQELLSAEPDVIVGPKFWNEIYKVKYKRAEPKSNDSQMLCEASLFWNKIGSSWQKLSFFTSMVQAELPCKLDKSNPSYDILFMLKILEGLNRVSFHLLSDERNRAFAEGRIDSFDDLKVIMSSVPQAEFMSGKLTDKLEQQMRDPLALSSGSMPLWCSQLMASCPFLFSFEARWKYFHLTAFGSSITQLNQIQHLNSSDTNYVIERRLQSGSFSRTKFKVNRNDVLGSAAKMMELHARGKAVLEVEYNEEVGTGLGPTMEFYTLVSHEFQKVGLGMWREDLGLHAGSGKVVGESGFVPAPFGLFPQPWSAANSVSNGIQFAEVIKKFSLLGQLVAKAIKDGRILDIPFSKAFYKVILEQELGMYDIESFDPKLGRTLQEFQALVYRKRFLESISKENYKCASDLDYRNTRIEDLCLGFTLPGYSDYELTSESNSKMVNISNLEEYVALVADATIKSGIARQVEAFKSGFNKVFPLRTLQIFTEDELERLLCGERDTWDFTELVDHIKFDHGYTASSLPVVNLLEIIQEFECDQRRAFLQFVTGARRLPPGGLAALNPKLTVVRKHCCQDADLDLPSVMTCANYLKLPPYSSKERMRQRMLYAITEGQGSFHLS